MLLCSVRSAGGEWANPFGPMRLGNDAQAFGVIADRTAGHTLSPAGMRRRQGVLGRDCDLRLPRCGKF
jgi:hypothetical protein